jgi:hypothetical protein
MERGATMPTYNVTASYLQPYSRMIEVEAETPEQALEATRAMMAAPGFWDHGSCEGIDPTPGQTITIWLPDGGMHEVSEGPFECAIETRDALARLLGCVELNCQNVEPETVAAVQGAQTALEAARKA